MTNRADEPSSTTQLRAVATQLRIGVGAFRRRAHELKADGDVAAPQLAALSRLERLGPLTTAQLARHEQITPQAMGSTVTSLADRGLVERRSDPVDKRVSIVSVTAAGRDVVKAGRSALTDHIADALSRTCTAEEIRVLGQAGALLERLAEAL